MGFNVLSVVVISAFNIHRLVLLCPLYLQALLWRSNFLLNIAQRVLNVFVLISWLERLSCITLFRSLQLKSFHLHMFLFLWLKVNCHPPSASTSEFKKLKLIRYRRTEYCSNHPMSFHTVTVFNKSNINDNVWCFLNI